MRINHVGILVLVENESLVQAGEIVRQFGIPRATLYRLAETGKIPFHSVPPQPWHQRKHYLFKVSEVASALERIQQERGR